MAMRNWLAACLIAAASVGQAQDVPPGEAVPAPTPRPPLMCGDDTVKPAAVTELMPGYGMGGFPVSTTVPQAQAFFDNGLQLGAAFAHQASIAAFKESVRLDPGCAMCLWGEAWASGPTINYPIDRAAMDKLAVLLVRAQTLSANAPPRERALISALKLRYAPGKAKDGNLAFARAMDAMTEAYPQDNVIATLAADAWLVTVAGEKDKPRAYRAMALLEGALQRDPDYTPAIHFYIHATEFADVPGRAEPYANRLGALAPRASHLVHMPSHTFYLVGRYQDAAEANARAVAIDIGNAERQGMAMPDGVWKLPYHAHNVHFGIGGALMSGDARTALSLGNPLVAAAASRTEGTLFSQMIAGMGYFAQGRFSDPAAVLALSEPKLAFNRAYWRYARGEAQARIGNAAAVRAEAAQIPWSIAVKQGQNWDVATAAVRLARIARLVLLGRAAMLENNPALALKSFAAATKLQEDKRVMGFSDPPIWWYPVRRSMAEAQLASGDAAGALREADTVLKTRPADPMTLSVRAKAQAALGNAQAAAYDRMTARRLWRGDIKAFTPALI